MAFSTRRESLALLEISLSSTCLSKSLFNARSHRYRPFAPPHGVKGLSTRQRQQQGALASAADDVRNVSTDVITGRMDAFTTPVEVERLLGQKRVDAAYQEFLAQASDGMLPPWRICDELITKLCTKQRYSQARQVYRVIASRDPVLKYNTYQALLNACLGVNDVDAALGVFRGLQADGMAPNKVTYCGLISGLGKKRRRGSRYAEVAYELWQELLESPYGSQLDAAALRTGMKACMDVGKLKEAEKLLRDAIAAKAPAAKDVRTYNILLKGYAMSGSARSQLDQIVRRMQDADVKPSCVTYNILIDSHVQSGEVEAARECMAAATAAGIELDAWSFTTLIKGLAQAGDMTGATAVLEDMRAANLKPNLVTFSTLIDGHARRGNLSAARDLLQAMVEVGEQPSAVTYNSLLRGYASTREPDALRQALQLLDDMQTQGVAPAVDTFNTLMSAALAADDGFLALDLHRRLLAAGLRPDGVTFTVLLQAHARLGQVSEAVGAFEALSRDPNAAMDIAAYNAMVDAFAVAGDMGAAENMLQRAAEFAKRSGLPPPVEAYGAVVSGYVRMKLVDPAVQTVRRFNAAGGNPDIQMLDMLADLCVRTGEFKIAMQAVRSMELIGAEVDKEKYRNMVLQRMERAAAAESKGKGRRGGGNTTKSYQNGSRPDKNTYLERFKFWLGLPNNYYNDSDG